MSRKAKDRTALETRIGYNLPTRICSSARSRTFPRCQAGNRAASYQRLEFLGDHVLGLVISDMLYRAFPKANEGELSRRLADLVRKETCAEVARAMDLGPALKLGNSESHAGGRRRVTILADVCEALIGAVFIDGGYEAADELIERFWKERMLKPLRPLRDAKDHVAGMGAGARPADAGLSRACAHRSAPRSGIPRRRRAAGSAAGGRPRQLQTRRRAGRRRRHA